MRALLLCNIFLGRGVRAEDVSIYVSAEVGSDSNPGTSPLTPLRSLAMALLSVPKLKASQLLVSGRFHLNETLNLTQAHTGLTIDQWQGQEAAVLSGGEAIPATAWRQLSDKVWSAQISQASAEALASKGSGRIFVNGVARSIIRTKTMYWDQPHGNLGFTMSPDDLDSSWSLDKKHVSQWRVAAFHSWTKAYHSVSEVDATNRKIMFGEPARFAHGDYKYCSQQRYYIEGIPELELSAGHWRLKPGDGGAGTELHYAPLPTEVMSKASVVVPTLDTILKVQGSRSVTLQNFALEYSSSGDCSDQSGFDACDADGAMMATNAMFAVKSDSLKIRNVIVRNAGGTGIYANNCPDLVIERVGIVSAAASGIGVYSSPRALINNSIVKGYGVRFPAGEGINLVGSPNGTVSHSDLCCGFYTGISGGGDNDTGAYSTYAFNHVHDIGSESDDGICDFAGYHGANTGSVLPIFITSNIFRNITAYANGGGGVYMDCGSAGYQVSRNLVHDVSASPVIWNNVKAREDGVPTRITNNVFVANRDNNYSRTKAAKANHFWGQGNPVFDWNGHTSAELERNVIVVSAESSPSRGEWFGGKPCAEVNGESATCTWEYADNFKVLMSRSNVWHNASSGDGSGSSTFPGGCNSTGSASNASWTAWGEDCVCRSWPQWRKAGQEASSVWVDPKLNGPLKLVSEPEALALGIQPLKELARAGANWTIPEAAEQSAVVLI